jgi:hypothetical protein
MLVDLWGSYGGTTIEMQRFARHIASLCALSSGCERNRSTFEFVSSLIHFICFHIVILAYLNLLEFYFICRSIQNKEIVYCTKG